ncbi:MAG: ABC transporter permease [Acidobacteriota bacterium]
MTMLLRDLRFAVRALLRRPGFSLVAVLCLGLGLGAVSTLAGLVDAVLLRPLPFADAERVVMVWNHFLQKELPEFPSSGVEFEDHRRDNRAFEHVAGLLPWDFNLSSSGDEPQRVEGIRASAALFSILGVEAQVGRTYTQREEETQERVVVLSHGLWQQRYGGGDGVLDESLELDGLAHTIVGVLPADFDLEIVEADVWVPFTPNPAIPRFMRGVQLMARLSPELSLQQAQAETDVFAQRLQRDYPGIYQPGSGWGIHLTPLRDEIVGDVRPLLWLLLAAVLLVLLIACANVANLQLTQASLRGGEMAVRAALGAGRRILLRQLVVESLLLATAGGLFGVALAALSIRMLRLLDAGGIPRLHEVALNPRVLLVVALVTALAGVLVGVWPALRLSPSRLQALLRGSGRGGDGAAAGKAVRSGLVVAEIALAMTVLIAAGVMVRSLHRMSQSDPGFEAANRLTLQTVLSRTAYRPAERKVEYYRALLERLERLPGVEAAAVVSHLPGSGKLGFRGVPEVEGKIPEPGTPTPAAGIRMISPGYFDTMAIPLLGGRDFGVSDDAQGTPVVIIDRAVAERFWTASTAIGQRLNVPGLLDEPRLVVGVVGEVNHHGLLGAPEEQIYVPYPQFPTFDLAPVLRTSGDPMALAEASRRVLLEVDPAQPVEDLRPLDARLVDSIAQPRFQALLFALFGGVALTLALVGVYGVMAFAVSRRTRELGIRLALGARRQGILKLVLGQGLRLALIGVAIGGLLSWLALGAAEGAFGQLVGGLEVRDLTTFLAIPVLLATMTLLACYLPARRATRIDPVAALHHE